MKNVREIEKIDLDSVSGGYDNTLKNLDSAANANKFSIPISGKSDSGNYIIDNSGQFEGGSGVHLIADPKRDVDGNLTGSIDYYALNDSEYDLYLKGELK